MKDDGGLREGRTGFQPVPVDFQGSTLFGEPQKRGTTRMFVKFLPRSRQAGSLSYCIDQGQRLLTLAATGGRRALLGATMVLMMPILAGGAEGHSLRWSRLSPLPDAEGFAACFAGVSGGALLVAGGANFPDKKPWDGGAKVWHDAVHVLDKSDGRWRVAGKLPRASGYGVSVTADDSVLCFGGSNDQGHHAEGFRLTWRRGRLETGRLPPLPKPCANMAWAMVGRTLYVAGGIEKPDSVECLRTLWALQLDRITEGWRERTPCPGPARMLAAGAADGDDFLLFSGASLSRGADGKPQRTYLRDAWRYSPVKGWTRLADLPRAAVAAPSPAPVMQGRVIVASGDDGSKVGFEPLAKHPGFPMDALAYHLADDSWRSAGDVPISRATAPTVSWSGGWIIPSGEVRPGVRTPEVWRLEMEPSTVRAPQ